MTDYEAVMAICRSQMTAYESQVTASGWSTAPPAGWSWMLDAGEGEPVLCWYLPNPSKVDCTGIVAFDGLTERQGVPVDEAIAAGNLWRRYVEGVGPNEWLT